MAEEKWRNPAAAIVAQCVRQQLSAAVWTMLLLLDDESTTDSSASSSSDSSSSDDDDDLTLHEFMFEHLFTPPEQRPKVESYLEKTADAVIVRS